MTRQSTARHARRQARRLAVPQVRAFLAECCVSAPLAVVVDIEGKEIQVSHNPAPPPVLYAAYLLWCAHHRRPPITAPDFHAIAITKGRALRPELAPLALEHAQRHGYDHAVAMKIQTSSTYGKVGKPKPTPANWRP